MAKVTDIKKQQATTAVTEESDWEVADHDSVMADYQEYQEEAAERRARGALTKLPDGKSTWRVMPMRKGAKSIFSRRYAHNVNDEVLGEAVAMLAQLSQEKQDELAKKLGVLSIVEPTSTGDSFRTWSCPSKNDGADCMMCDIVSALFRLGRLVERAKVLAKEMSSRQEIVVNAVRLDAETEMGVRALQLNEGLFKTMISIFDSPTAGGDFSHPDTGFNLVFTKAKNPKKQFKTADGRTLDGVDYNVIAERASTPIADRSWLKGLHDLTRLHEAPDPAFLRNLIEGGGPVVDAGQVSGVVSAPQLGAASGPLDEVIEDPFKPGVTDTREKLHKQYRRTDF